MKTIQEFIKNYWFRNAWIKHPKLRVYVRSSHRLISKGKMDYSFEIANVTAKKPGKGHFTQFLNELEEMLKGTEFKLLYIENVTDERFQKFFENRGFKVYMDSVEKLEGFGICYIKRIN